MPPPAPAWRLPITNLSGPNATLRMRIWRALKAAGAGLLLAGVAREVSAVVARDFFPGEPRKQMEGALADAEGALSEAL